ncbi:MAG: phage protease, partial [Caulobacteraceae bacterium]
AKADGAVTKLVNVALTNRPAIEELAAVAASATNGDPMSLKNIAGALGLAETADEEAICAAISELKKPAEGAAAASATAQATLGKVAAALGVKADAKEDELVAAATQAKAAQPDPAQYAPKAVVDELQGQLKTLQEEQSERAATAAVDAAMAAGKVSPATKAWALNLAKGDPKSFEAYVAAAAVIVPPGERRPPGTPPAGEVSLTDEDKAACAAIGMSEDDFLKAKK